MNRPWTQILFILEVYYLSVRGTNKSHADYHAPHNESNDKMHQAIKRLDPKKLFIIYIT